MSIILTLLSIFLGIFISDRLKYKNIYNNILDKYIRVLHSNITDQFDSEKTLIKKEYYNNLDKILESKYYYSYYNELKKLHDDMNDFMIDNLSENIVIVNGKSDEYTNIKNKNIEFIKILNKKRMNIIDAFLFTDYWYLSLKEDFINEKFVLFKKNNKIK